MNSDQAHALVQLMIKQNALINLMETYQVLPPVKEVGKEILNDMVELGKTTGIDWKKICENY